MLDKKIEKALNQQINNELEASYTYMAMAAHFDKLYLDGFGAWMQAQSDEERTHAYKLFRYVLDRDGDVSLEAIKKPKNDYQSVRDVISRSLEQEKANTRAIHELYDLAREVKDFATLAHLDWFLAEQVEEEKIMTELLGRLALAGDDKTALLILDEQLAPRADRTGGLTMDFRGRLEKAIERGERARRAQADEAAEARLGEAELKRLVSDYRLQLSEHIEKCLAELAQHVPGFRVEGVANERGWGAAVSRDDFAGTAAGRQNFYSRLEIAVRPITAPAFALELSGKGTVRNKEVFQRRRFQKLEDIDLDSFQELIDSWVLEFAEIYARQPG